jgi:hypothetical protein
MTTTTKPKTYTPPQAYEEGARPHIALSPVVSSQVAAIGYDETTRTLAMTFTRGEGAVYHYADVSPETFAALKTAESIGAYFGKHIKPLTFKKYRPTTAECVQA